MTPAQQIALWADRLRDLSASALMYTQDIYNQERFTAIQTIVREMMALVTDSPPEQLEPIKASVLAHATPFSVGDAAVIDDEGRILLIQRADNQLWAMPGGALEVGETPAEGIAREAFEETGVKAEAVAFVGIFDSRLCGTMSRHHLYQLVFLCKPLNKQSAPKAPSHANEVVNAGWFAEDQLPSNLDPGHKTRIPEAYRIWHGDHRAFFDRASEE